MEILPQCILTKSFCRVAIRAPVHLLEELLDSRLVSPDVAAPYSLQARCWNFPKAKRMLPEANDK